MKQRKKIKYVEKHPPDKQNQQKETQNLYPEKREEKRQPKNYQQGQSTYLRNQNKHQQQTQNKKYAPKQEGPTGSNNDQRQRKNYNENRKHRAEYEVPSKYEEKASSSPEDNCVICSELIKRKEKVWNCTCCCISIHLFCMKQWIFNLNKNDGGTKHKLIFNWNCPQCKFQFNEPMPKYYCFCGKYQNPEFDRSLNAHSCGQICKKKRGANCTHPCPNICHKGKCPPCTYQGKIVSCQCGKSQRKIKCSEDSQTFQCGKKCEKILNCHKHKCERNCHYGNCLPCKKKHMVECYCGKNQDVVDCIEVSYSCEDICGRNLECGFHKCEDKCHIGQCNPCSKTPQQQKTCPCGKYAIEMLTGDADFRKSCADAIPVCGMPCSKKLDCGHICPRSCHEGPCPQCKVICDQHCTCQLTSRKIECWRKNKEHFKCENICKKKRSCGLHNCNTECCKFRNSFIVQDHQCEQTCTKILNCEKHDCGEPCHIGLCKKCPVIYSQPQPCPCGRTFLKPPVFCGTLAPECDNVCGKQMSCGHQCLNSCHYGACRCYEDVYVLCRCGLEKIKTTCGRQTLCMKKCEKVLDCGHVCGLQCHKGTCIEAHKSEPCRKKCKKQRKDCSHFCSQLCHPNKKCESYPCEAEILIKCACSHRQTTILCGAADQTKKFKKEILCNKKCENLKRFDLFYKNKQMYYPSSNVHFAFRNFAYLQKLENRLEKFILYSEETFIEVEFKFNDPKIKVLLINLFENHYHLNCHFYRANKFSSFTLMQTQNTMIPKPLLSQYAKKISNGTIKNNSIPFEVTIVFECQHWDKMEMMLKNIKEYLHKYYVEKKQKTVYVHFWVKEDGQRACSILQREFLGVEFRRTYNETKIENQEIKESEIVDVQMSQSEINAPKFVKIVKSETKEKENQQKQKLQQTQQKKQEKTDAPRLIIRRTAPTFKKNSYPQSKQNVQDIYAIDQDELFNEKIDWDKFIQTICSKNMGPEATEWRIRILIMISSFHHVKQSIFFDQFERLIGMYNKDKERAVRILQLQKLDNKSVQSEMASNGIYLSDHEPEMLSYLILYNYFAIEKLEIEVPQLINSTPEMTKTLEIIQSMSTFDFEEFQQLFKNSDYVYCCALIPFIHGFREIMLEKLSKKNRLTKEYVYKSLLFESEEQLFDYFLKNGIQIEAKISKTQKEECYYYKSGELLTERYHNDNFIKRQVHEKRDKKYFLTEPEETVDDKFMIRSFFAFGDFKESKNRKYMNNLVKQLKNNE